MAKPIAIPGLPRGRVTLAAASAAAPDILECLGQEGIEVLPIAPAHGLPPPVAAHSDLQLLHLGGRKILLAQEAGDLAPELTSKGFLTELLDRKLGDQYPQDISLNFLLLKKCCFGLCSGLPLQLQKLCNDAGIRIIDSKQGYARCSVAVVSENAAITADRTLYRLLTGCGVNVLLVDSGDILLPGYNTGFIGGCCGLIGQDRLAFAGELDCYRSGKAVLEFLDRHRVQPVYLRPGKLLDIGGIVPLLERE